MSKITENSKWLSNDRLKIVGVISSNNDLTKYIEYPSSDNMIIKKTSSKEFCKNFEEIDMDTSLSGGLPKHYMGEPVWF